MPLQNTFTLDVDSKKKSIINEPTVTQNDEVTFILNVYDDGREFDLSGVSTSTLVSERPDKQSVMTLGSITGTNQITFALGSTEISKVGKVDAAIQLFDVDGRVTTLPFSYKVLKDPSSGYIPSTDEQTLIELVLGEGPAILDAAEQAAIDANNASTNANDKALIADTAATNANNAAANANEKALLADEKATLASKSAADADSAKFDAENAAQDALIATDAINEVLPNVQGLENKGEYKNDTSYVKNNVAELNGSSWQALQNTKGNPPPTLPVKSNAFWTLVAQRGIDGTGAVSSVNGVGPDVNGDVTLDIATSWNDLNDKPSSFPPSAHTHTIENITELQTTLNSKANKTQEGWKTAILQNGWAGNLVFKKDDMDVVHLRGTISGGTITADTILTNLPLGYRPTYQAPLPSVTSGAATVQPKSIVIYVQPNGDVLFEPASDLVIFFAHSFKL